MNRVAFAICVSLQLSLTSCAIITHGKGSGKCPLPDEKNFDRSDFHAGASGHSYPLYVTHGGQAPFLILHPLGGLDPCTLEVCKELEDRGWKVYAPILDGGTYGERNIARSFVHIRRDRAWKVGDPDDCGEVLNDMRELVQSISRTHGGRRVVVMGNCITGGMPLGMLDLACVSTAVLCQPALPFGERPRYRGVWALPDDRLDAMTSALGRDPTKRILGFHFYEDPVASYRKFETLHDRLGPQLEDRFRPVVVLRGSSRLPQPVWWDESNLRTSVRPSLSEPHSTVCGAMDPRDRRQLRKRFFELLGPAPL